MTKKALNLLLFLIVISATAQNRKVTVSLKNGAVIKGNIIESGSTGKIKIESRNNTWVFDSSEVDKILQQKRNSVLNTIEIPYFFKVEAVVLPGNSNNSESAPGYFHGSFNYEIAEKLYAGGGTGVEYYMEESYIPAFANLEYRFRKTRFSPYLFLKSGYLLSIEKQIFPSMYLQSESRNIPPKYLDSHGGLLINPGVGFTSMLGANFGFGLSFGFRYHTLNFTGKEQYELDQHYYRLSLALSIIFK